MCSSIRRLSEGFTVYVQNKTVSIQMSVGKERSCLWDYNQLFSKTFQATKNISLLKRFQKKHTLPNTRPNKKLSYKLDRLDTWVLKGCVKHHKGLLDIPKSTNQPWFFPKQFTVGVLNATLDPAALVLVGVVGFLGSEVVLFPVVSGCLPSYGGWVLVGVAAFLGSEVVLPPGVSGCLPSCGGWVLVGMAASRTKTFRNQNHRFQSKFAYCKLFGVYAGVILRTIDTSNWSPKGSHKKKNDTRKDSSHPSLTEETVELWDPYLCRNWEEAKIHNRHPQHLSNEKGVPSCLGIRVYESYKGMK